MILILLLGSYCTGFCLKEQDDAQTFSQLKKYVGTWQTSQEGKKIIEIWTVDKKDKHTITIKRYALNDHDSTLVMDASINYYKFIRFHRPSSIHYHIHHQQEGIIYPFRLDTVEGTLFEFTNFNNPYPNRIIYHFTAQNSLTVRVISKDKMQQESWQYERNTQRKTLKSKNKS